MACTHTDVIEIDRPAEADKDGAVCEDCVKIDGTWVHLRICRTCGHVGCCDSSPNRHARAHWEARDHPIVTSMEPREIWSYCFIDDAIVRGA